MDPGPRFEQLEQEPGPTLGTPATQRGGTFLLDLDNTLAYGHCDRGILGFPATMARPLQCLEPFLSQPAAVTP